MESDSPLVGIPCRHDRSVSYSRKPVYAQGELYLRRIVEAGGTPFLIPLDLPEKSLRALYDLADGILLAGGGDIEPSLYGGALQPYLRDVHPTRDRDEIAVARRATAERKPLLGICRGVQVLAVAAGGSLVQDVPSELPEATLHRKANEKKDDPDETFLAHAVLLSPSSRLVRIVGTDTIRVNSLHHQAVAAVPAPWQVVGRSTDGVNEAIEQPSHPFMIGVQWHPELLAPEHESARRLFQAFVTAGEQFRRRR